MSSLKKAQQVYRDAILRRPDLEEDLADLLQLMVCEIEGGESEANETDLFLNNVSELEEEADT